MQKYSLKNLFTRWEHEELTNEQTIGQLILWLQWMVEIASKTQNQMDTLKGQIEELTQQTKNQAQQLKHLQNQLKQKTKTK